MGRCEPALLMALSPLDDTLLIHVVMMQCSNFGCTSASALPQYCVSPPNGGRPCLDGYYFSNGGCALCRVTIPNWWACVRVAGGEARRIGRQPLRVTQPHLLGPSTVSHT